LAIDVKTVGSPGWWLQKGSVKLAARLPRLQKLADYHEGRPPLPTGVAAERESFQAFQRKSCTNLAELIVGSKRERVSVRDIRTAASGDVVDAIAWDIYKSNGLDVEFADVLENMLVMGDSYMIIGLDINEEVIMTGEDPRQVVTFHNPARQSDVRAATKMFHDPDESRDYAYQFLPGGLSEDGTRYNARRYVAFRDRKSRSSGVSFSASAYSWDESRGGESGEELNHELVPVVRFRNRRGVGEFEPHLDILDRINHTVYTRMIIALYQAFKQRVIHVDVDDAEDENGQPIDSIPDDVLTSDPGSWVQLPLAAKITELSQADMNGVLMATKDDIRLLAAVTRRPLAMFAPDNQSASGSEATSEGLTFSTEDTQNRAGDALTDAFRIAFLALGDVERAEKSKIVVGWKPASRFGITDKANASAQASTVLAKRTIMRTVWQMSPEEIDQAEAESADEALLLSEVAPSGNPA
jgi:hypothetical protein